MEHPAKIDGIWQIVKAELAGEEMPAFVAEKIEVELSGGSYIVRFAGEVSDRGTVRLGTSGDHKAMHLTGVEGANAGRTIPAIYQHVGDRLRVCYGLDGTAPGAFATGTGQKHYLATYRRRDPSA
jgi:uncharacterized protein (TIGR03067 family)